MRSLLYSGIILLIPNFGFSQSYSQIVGYGGYTCRDAISLEQTDRATARRSYGEWLAGYLSGRNLSRFLEAGLIPTDMRFQGYLADDYFAESIRMCRLSSGAEAFVNIAEEVYLDAVRRQMIE